MIRALGFGLFVIGALCLALWVPLQISGIDSHKQIRSVALQLEEKDLKPNYIERLAKSIQFQTVSSKTDPDFSESAFVELNAFLSSAYPKAFKAFDSVHVFGHSRLLKLTGQDSKLDPVLLIAHMDVVPAQPLGASLLRAWKHPPFSGHLDHAYIWGRGALDNKSVILAVLESIEALETRNWKGPQRTIYLAFTHDEEVGGHHGAKQIASYFKQQGQRFHFILDEGQAITQGVVPNIDLPVALIGVTQKGYMTVELKTEGEPGHSMIPPPATAISILSAAIKRLTDSPMPPQMAGPVKAMFKTLSRYMRFPNNFVLYHTWLTEPLVTRALASKPTTDALIRSSMSVNVIQGGIAENVLPASASALINYRIAPHNDSDTILAHIDKTLLGLNVSATVVSAVEEPAPISEHEDASYALMSQVISTAFPDAVVAPSITLSTTDSRHFVDLSDQILRFSPIFLTQQDLPRFHGLNERISRENYRQMIEFYYQLMSRL